MKDLVHCGFTTFDTTLSVGMFLEEWRLRSLERMWATGRVMLAWLASGSNSWSRPQGLTPSGLRAESPIVRVVGSRLVLAYRVGDEVRMLDMAPPPANETGSSLIIDSGDPVGASGDDPEDRDGGDDQNESSSSSEDKQRDAAGSMEANGSSGRRN